MKKLSEIKDEVARSKGLEYDSWNQMEGLIDDKAILIERMEQVAKRYAEEAIKAASRRVSGWPTEIKTESEIEDSILNLINELQ